MNSVRFASALVLAGATLLVFGSASRALPADGNSANAKLCQKGGWRTLVQHDGAVFSSTGECVSYAARGGVFASFTGCFIVDTNTGSYNNAPALALHDAVLAASRGDALTVLGTCRGGVTIDKDLTISGLSSPGYGTPTLEGDGSASVLHVTCGIACGAHVTIAGLTLTNGSGAAGTAGGVFSENSNVILADSTLSGNAGRGAYAHNGSLTLTRCTVSGNTGGGVGTDFGVMAIDDTSIRDNTGGSGIRVNFSFDVTVTNSTISGNTADLGGGIFNANIFSVVSVTNSTILGNTATADGGGVYNGGLGAGGTAVTLTDSSVRANTAARGGGIANGIGSAPGAARVGVVGSIVTGNTATTAGGGGGVFNDGGSVTLSGGSSVTLNYSPAFPIVNNCVGTVC